MINEFILPGLFNLQKLNFIFLDYYHNHKNEINEDYTIGGIYGNFPFCLWNGEQANFSNYLILNNEMEHILLQYASFHVKIHLNCTNTELTTDMLEDTYSNLILDNIEKINASNHIVVNSEILYKYIKDKYPYALIDIGQYNAFLPIKNELIPLEEYCNFFINPAINNNFNLINTFINKKTLVFLLNPPLCINNCSIQNECLLKEHLAQILYDPRQSRYQMCANWLNNTNLETIQQSNLYIHPQEIKKYNQLGINHFFIKHYNNIEDTLITYVSYFFKSEFQAQAINDLKFELIKDGAI